MNTEQIKKATRVFFYGITIATSVTLLSLTIIFFTSSWEDMWPIVVILSLSAAVFGLFKLANWAFTPEHRHQDDSTVPHYYNGSFIGDFPNYPYTGQRVNGYVWTHDTGRPINSAYWKKEEN